MIFNKKVEPKILLWDLETSLLQALTFGTYNQNISHSNILVNPYIICVSYKWLGENKIHTISILDDKKRFKKDVHDDYYVCKEFYKIIEQADAHVAHNGTKFDLPFLVSRLMANALPPLPEIRNLDTYRIARRGRFASNRLDYLAKLFGHAGKMHNPPDLWKKCFYGEEKAVRHMIKYNKQDISALEVVFSRLRPFIKSTLNQNLFTANDVCPNCGGKRLQKRGFNLTRTRKTQRYQCTDCGGWSSSSKSIKTASIK